MSATHDEKSAGQPGDGQPSLLDELLEVSRSVPDEEWAKLPVDGAENVDWYLHGRRRLSADRGRPM
jgi:hypothetical protein